MDDTLDRIQIFEPKRSPTTTSKKINLLHLKLPVKRPSLQSLLAPTFFQTSSSPTSPAPSLSSIHPTGIATFEDLANITIPAAPSPLLDEDPFANLLSSPSVISLSEHPFAYSNPSVAFHPSRSSSTVPLPSQAYLQPHIPKRPKSSGHGQVRPANTKPAFSSRPSLPSLHTLAQMNIAIPRKPRKGAPGARLPHEPWDMDSSTRLAPPLGSHAEPPAGPSKLPPVALVPQMPVPLKIGQDFTLSLGVTPTAATWSSTPEKIHIDPDDLGSTSHSTSGRPTSLLHDADIDSLPSLSYTASEPSSSALSRSSSILSSPCCETQINVSVNHAQAADISFAHEDDQDDPLNYYSDFDYYTQPHSDCSDSDLDLPSKVRSQTSTPGTTPTTYTSLYSPDISSYLAPFFHTIPPALHELPQSNMRHASPTVEDAPRDGNGTTEQRGAPPRQGGEEDRSGGHERRKEGSHHSGNRSGGYGHGGGRDNGDSGRRPSTRSPVWSDSEYYSSSSDERDPDTVYYSVDGTSNGNSCRPQSRARSVHPKMVPGSDDDVPLAQSMPTALMAQKSIRKQLRDERHQRRIARAKSTRTATSSELPPVPALPRAVTHGRQRSASAAPTHATSRDNALPIEPFPVDDLEKKLANLQVSIHPSTARVPVPSSAPQSLRPQAMDDMTFLRQIPPYTTDKSPQEKRLRSVQSSHRSEGRTVDIAQPRLESSLSQALGRKPTTISHRTEDLPVRRNKSVTRTSRDDLESRNRSDSHLRSARVSEDSRRPMPTIPRVSTDRDVEQRVPQRPPVPPVELVNPRSPPFPATKVLVTQQRVFIGDMQQFKMVEITSNTSAGDVIASVASQGSLDRTGVWMLFELANDFGIERPIRSYELLSDVTASWNRDKLLNAFVIKRTYLAPFLSPSNIPTSSPTNRGYVDWESKKGKWSKRWMELREHSLWLSKRDTGKDETFLCSLSNFDAYYVTRKHKSPKPFVFAIKSTDNISLFEDVSDYLHVLSCNQKDGERWMEAILVARSYVLYQERNVLFAKPGDNTSNSNTASRSRTRKQSVSARPSQPLVNVSAPFSTSATAGVTFEPGSLLAKRGGDIVS